MASATTREYLNASKSAWVELGQLDEELSAYGSAEFQKLFDLHPAERGQVVMFNKNVESPRWHQSFGNTPKYNPSVHDARSYMYAASHAKLCENMPAELLPFLDHFNAREPQGSGKFDQMIVNWFGDENDYLPAHADCMIGLLVQSPIVCITLVGADPAPPSGPIEPRTFLIRPRKGELEAVQRQREIPTRHGCTIRMGGDMQAKFVHQIKKMPQGTRAAPRISITLRKSAVQDM